MCVCEECVCVCARARAFVRDCVCDHSACVYTHHCIGRRACVPLGEGAIVPPPTGDDQHTHHALSELLPIRHTTCNSLRLCRVKEEIGCSMW